MRHKASGPLVHHLHRLRCTAARVLEVGAGNRPGRSVVVMAAVACLATGGYITVAAATSGNAPEPVDTAAPPASHAAPSSDPISPAPGPTGEVPVIGPSQPHTSQPEPTKAPTPSATFESETPSPTPTEETDQPGRVIPPTPTSSFNEPGDVTAPRTSLLQERPEPDAAQFTFNANEESTFACSLDGAEFTACDSPMFFDDLKPGWHTFAVVATDVAGNTDPTPAQARWHVNGGNPNEE